MFTAHSPPRHLLSLLVLLCLVAHVEAQGIPLPSETPRAGTYTTPAVKARSKTTWRPKGSVVPAQAEEPVSEPEPAAAAEPTLAPPLEGSAAEVQYLRAPANAAEQTAESGWQVESEPRPAQLLPPRANPLRQASRPQAYVPQTPYQRSPYQRVQNPVDVEVEPEPLPRPAPPRVIKEMQRHQYPGQFPTEVDDRVGVLQEPESERQYADSQYPDEQVPGQELYGLPRVFETNGYGRFTGRGEPLTAGSWLNRPYYVGGFIGGTGGDTLVAGEINSNGGFFWGGNLGWDYDPYWGLEMRLAFSKQGLDYLNYPTIDAESNDLILWDTSFLYYPWGDARWRPYFKLGFGFADFDYRDTAGYRRSEMVYEMPFGVGMKYRVNQYWVWRFDVTDNLIFGGNAGLETQNQFSLAAGLEYRFGGRRQSYWPWNPSRRWR